jgi:hypothetical protein
MKQLILLLALVTLLLAPAAFPKSKASASSGKKTTSVREYTRKDGTVVRSHPRSASSQAPSKSKNPKVYCASCERDSRGKIRRSETARHAFQKSHPCPATRKTTGACPGYVIDHVVPLKRGGADDPRNMQWQTTAQAKAKDRVED